MRDELRDEVAGERLVVVQADVGALRRRVRLLRRAQQHEGVSPPCGDRTTRKKLASVVKGPSGCCLSEMPGFSPDHSTCPGNTIVSAMASSSRCGATVLGTLRRRGTLIINT
jgi:hypothetical protein